MGTEPEDQDVSLRAGTVTRLVRQRKDPNRVSIFVDGVFVLGAHDDLVLSFDVHRGRVLSIEELEALQAAEAARAAVEVAVAYLGERARTTHEVREKLVRKGFSDAATEHAMNRLTDLGYLDDGAYARQYVQARFRNRGYGPRRLRAELQRRGVARPLIDAAMEGALSDADTLAAARTHAATRWNRLASEEDPRKRRKKVGDYLVRRGFAPDTVWRVVDELAHGEQS